MPIFRGRGIPGEEGFECEEFEGFDVSPNGKYWGNEPISLEKEKELDEIYNQPKESRRDRRKRERN